MENTICPHCNSLPTHHKYKVCGAVVCPQCSSDRGFDELNDVWYKDCNQKPVQNPICPKPVQNMIYPEPVQNQIFPECL